MVICTTIDTIPYGTYIIYIRYNIYGTTYSGDPVLVYNTLHTGTCTNTYSHKHELRQEATTGMMCMYHELLLPVLASLVSVSTPALCCCCCCCSSAKWAGLFSRIWTTSKCFLLLMFGCCLIITRSPTRHLSSGSWQRYFRCLLMYCIQFRDRCGGRKRGMYIVGYYSTVVQLLYCKTWNNCRNR